MKYEYGYILIAGGESQTVILGTVDEAGLAEREKTTEVANRMERTPGLREKVLSNPAIYFVRPIIKDEIQREEGDAPGEGNPGQWK